MKHGAFGLGLLFLLVGFAWGRETEDANPLSSAPSWFDQAQKHDWESADYEDLKSWAKELGLDSTGTASELRTRVGQALNFQSTQPASQEKLLTIQSAQEAGFVNVERPGGGKALRLSGGVHLIYVDKTKNVTHDIVCAELWYDQDLGEMTARGNVVYTLVKGTTKDVFHGDSLTFRLKDSEGIFYGGSSVKDQTVQGVTLTFHYKGQTVRRTGDDVIVMEDGTISSSTADPPNYALKASKIWVLAPGEWGIQNAVLWVGRVPVFYFPFYFQPGDDFFFNPVLGFPGPSDPRGTYLQTTTYFYGAKKKGDDPMSFLQLSDSGSDVQRVQRGLFMVRGTPPPQPPNWVLKMTADSYSNLGFLNGFYAEMPGVANMTTFKWWTTLGLTHPVDTFGNPYSLNPFDGLTRPWNQFQWDEGYFGPWTIPLRWGAHVEGTSPDYTFKFEFYTDPSLYGETFSNRSEDFSLTTLLGLNSNVNTYTTPTVQSTLSWQLAMNTKTFPLPWSFWNTLTVSKLEGDAEWDEKANAAVSNAFSPSSNIYAPSLFVFPSVSFSTGGKLWDSNASATTTAAAAPSLVAPWPSNDSKTKDTSTQNSMTSSVSNSADFNAVGTSSGLIAPALQSSFTLPTTLNSSSGNVAWTWAPTWRNETRYDTTKWVQPGETNWAVQTQEWFLNQNADVAYVQTASDNFWNLKEDFNFNQTGQKTWVLGSGITDPTSYEMSDASNSQTQLFQTFNPSLNPLVSFPPLAASSIAYTLKSRLWSNTYTTWDSTNNTPVYQNAYWDGTADSVPLHNVTATLNWEVLYPDPVLSSFWTWSDDLKPRPTNQSLGWTLTAAKDWGSATSNLTYRDQGLGWKPDPWVSNVTWKPLDGFSLSQDYTYDLENKKPQSAISTMNAWGFQTKYTAQQTLPYHFDTASRSWIVGSQNEFLDSELDFTWNDTWTSPRFWRGRAYAGLGVNSSWLINLQQYTQMPLTFGYTASLSISKFLDLSLSHNFTNDQMYMYFPGIVHSFGIPTLQPRNFWQDTFNSLAFWDYNALKQGTFKASSIALNLKHYMDDWQLQLNYMASPQIPTGSTQYQWVSTLTLLIQWFPFPQVKANVQEDQDNQWSIQNPQTTTGS